MPLNLKRRMFLNDFALLAKVTYGGKRAQAEAEAKRKGKTLRPLSKANAGNLAISIIGDVERFRHENTGLTSAIIHQALAEVVEYYSLRDE